MSKSLLPTIKNNTKGFWAFDNTIEWAQILMTHEFSISFFLSQMIFQGNENVTFLALKEFSFTKRRR